MAQAYNPAPDTTEQNNESLQSELVASRDIQRRQRLIAEVVHDKIVRLFAEIGVTPEQLMQNQKTIRDGYITPTRTNADELLVLYQRDADLYSEDTEEIEKLNHVVEYLEAQNPLVPDDQLSTLVQQFSMQTNEPDNLTTDYLLETGLGDGTYSEISVGKETAEGIENQLNIGQLIFTSGDYAYDPDKAGRVLDTQIDELLPAATNRQRLIDDFFRLYAELRPPDYPDFEDTDGDGLTDFISQEAFEDFVTNNNISNAVYEDNKFITWLREQEDDANDSKSIEWLYQDLKGFFKQSELSEASIGDARPEYINKSSGYLKLRSLNQGVLIRKQEGTDIGLTGPDPDNPNWAREDGGFCISMWVRFLNKVQTGTLFNFGSPFAFSPKGFALETMILKDDDEVDFPAGFVIGTNTSTVHEVGGNSYSAREVCDLIEESFGYNPLQGQDSMRFLRLAVQQPQPGGAPKYYDNSMYKYGLPKYNRMSLNMAHGDYPKGTDPNSAWALFTYPQVPIDLTEWYFINASYDPKISDTDQHAVLQTANENILNNPMSFITSLQDNEVTANYIEQALAQVDGNKDRLAELWANNHLDDYAQWTPSSNRGNRCVVEFISRSDLLRARGFKVE